MKKGLSLLLLVILLTVNVFPIAASSDSMSYEEAERIISEK